MTLGEVNTVLKKIEIDAKAIDSRLSALIDPKAVQLINIDRIFTDEAKFQNRESAFSEDSSNRILKAIRANQFRWSIFDPITLWESPGGKLYVLSGHSRTAAFRQASKIDYDFQYIPAKIIKGISEEEAKEIAQNSNTLSTKESDVERASYYRRLRQAGLNLKEINEKARDAEGKNAKRILALSHLNPKGFLIDSLKVIEGKDPKTAQTINVIAEWVGSIRGVWPNLTNSHEKELTDFLLYGGYGTKAGQFSNRGKFIQRVRVAVDNNTEFGVFDDTKPLNIKKNVSKNSGEQEHEAITKEIRAQMEKTQRTLTQKQAQFYRAANEGVISEAKARQLIEPYAKEFAVQQQKLIDHMRKKDDYRKRGESQSSLFGIPCLCHTQAAELGVEELDGVDIYEKVNQVILEALDDLNAPWIPRFDRDKKITQVNAYGDVDRNYVSNRPYSGINILILWANKQADKTGKINTPFWLTFNQIKELGGTIEKGTKATQISFFTLTVYQDGKYSKMPAQEAKKRIKKGDKSLKIVPIMKLYNVFNAGQVKGVNFDFGGVTPKSGIPEKRYLAQAIWEGFPNRPELVAEDPKRAFYRPLADVINMPIFELFSSPEAYYSTLMHESIHSTGNAKRVGREFGRSFGSEKYAFEELVAEIGQAYLTSYAGIYMAELKSYSAEYMRNWANAVRENLKEDKQWFFKAAGDAQKGANYILDNRQEDYMQLLIEGEALKIEDSLNDLSND